MSADLHLRRAAEVSTDLHSRRALRAAGVSTNLRSRRAPRVSTEWRSRRWRVDVPAGSYLNRGAEVLVWTLSVGAIGDGVESSAHAEKRTSRPGRRGSLNIGADA